MQFTIGSRALNRASAFNPTTKVVITNYTPNVWDAYVDWVPLQVHGFGGPAFTGAATLRDGTPECNTHHQVLAEEPHVTVLPDLCERLEFAPQPLVDPWESGLAARDAVERITATQASYFVGAQS